MRVRTIQAAPPQTPGRFSIPAAEPPSRRAAEVLNHPLQHLRSNGGGQLRADALTHRQDLETDQVALSIVISIDFRRDGLGRLNLGA